MFPSELELEYRLREMQRDAEHQRLVRSLRTSPSLWNRIRARFNTRPAYATVNEPLVRRDVIAHSRS